MRVIAKPELTEYPANASGYITLVPDDGRVLWHLEQNLLDLYAALIAMPDAQLLQPYAPGKWTIKEIVSHVIDAERIFGYRALRFARGDETPLADFDQDRYVPESGANQRSMSDLMGELKTVRRSTIALFKSLPDATLLRYGTATGRRFTVRAMLYYLTGHAVHHVREIHKHYPVAE